ncbi:uncharacterized protein LOC109703810 [Ananas comosus]|uniref:Uncharacterized protein LOC109703810 n=1 Tax=Ananas comosus TaxID=4615 RepID=A0A6P5EEP0_ANACO|nr:uncharacterized protein LOC109703810 [Ananas comosus]
MVQRQQEAAVRQEEQMKRLQETVDRLVAAPAAARRGRPGVAAEVVPSRSGDPTPDTDPWIVEMWIDSIETLFEDLYTLERDKVNLAVHYLKQSAKVWWKGVKQDRSPGLPPMTWEEFRGLLFLAYFPDSEKRKLKERFQKLRQGDRSVRQYEREFFRIVHCVPNVVRDDRDKADCFVRGLRPSLYKAVLVHKLRTFAEVLDRALWIEQDEASLREEREAYYKEKGKGRPTGGSSGQSSSQRTSSSSHSRSRAPGTYRIRSSAKCAICGGPHFPQQCEQREGKCFKCGLSGHMRDECPRGDGRALALATALSFSRTGLAGKNQEEELERKLEKKLGGEEGLELSDYLFFFISSREGSF